MYSVKIQLKVNIKNTLKKNKNQRIVFLSNSCINKTPIIVKISELPSNEKKTIKWGNNIHASFIGKKSCLGRQLNS